jgi:3-phenylpropionate/cinnamic acid dioxygenase small subunit
MAAMQRERDPSRSSWYIDDAYYRRLVADFSDWQLDELAATDRALRDRCRALLEREARLLDQGRFEDWLGMYAPECLYWVPGTAGGGDPRREVALAFDDRRQLEGRIYRIRTGYAWSQVPQSRTVRLISNVEVFRTHVAEILMVRSNFMLSEFRSGESRILSGWCAHRIAEHAGQWRILVKQANLIDCDQSLRNPSVIL